MPPDQVEAAKQTREIIDGTIGPYSGLKAPGATSGVNTGTEKAARALKIAWRDMELQWVQGDAVKAETSFFTINQSATAIDRTELEIIKARKKPNALAARAIIRAGTGHRYWEFDGAVRKEIEAIASELHNLLFDPPVQGTIKTLDLPVSPVSLRVAFEFINHVNGLKPEMWVENAKPKRTSKSAGTVATHYLTDDLDGKQTIECLKKAKGILTRMTGDSPRSLALHPAVYFYSATGRSQPTTILAVASLMQQLELTNGFGAFTANRKRFEDFIVTHHYFVNQIAGGYGAGKRSLGPLVDLYKFVLDGLGQDQSDEMIAKRLLEMERFKGKLQEDTQGTKGARFTKETKNAAYLKKAIAGAPPCAICGARLHVKGITTDHKIRRQDGGDDSLANAQLAHPYCNSGYKESLHAKERKAASEPSN